MQPDAPGDGLQFLKLVWIVCCISNLGLVPHGPPPPHVGGVEQTKIIIFYEGPECLQFGYLAVYRKGNDSFV